ncbi:hypothetical protein FYK55_00330 [Roseiconus nitratireducens]|uniref:Uncharacterized protein n=1 Tax=Roseiconus nitratireducens TaxID=2605748 RepID=A0A5M6DHB2_9BACT|nr:hypothetical protein [Roseiconus nitratireducens]KAA5546911.1 hypothetical protein FYK55_00330 [Roseiconus nitratireducens]
MTAPFAPPPPRSFWLILAAMVAVFLAAPAGRREDWIGWLAFAVMVVAAAGLWSMLALALGRRIVTWWREPSPAAADLRGGSLFADHQESLAWDERQFSLRGRNGKPLVAVPLGNLLEVIDGNALFTEGDVIFAGQSKRVSFPRSRPERVQLIDLIRQLSAIDLEARTALQALGSQLLRKGLRDAAIGVILTAILLTPIFCLPEPARINLGWIAFGLVYGLAWHGAFVCAAKSICSLAASFHVHRLLRSSPMVRVDDSYLRTTDRM